MRKIYYIVMLLVSFEVSAQQDTQFSHYVFNQLFVNPATAGSENVTRFQAIYRTQYLGYQSTFDDGGAPVTQEYADVVGADGFAADASTAVRIAKDLIAKKRATVSA